MTNDDISWRARSIMCPLCRAKVGEDCVTRTGKPFTRVGIPGLHIHAARDKAAEKPIRTKTGKVLTDADIQALADEAERGYDVSHLKMHKKRKYILRHKAWVWCPVHGIHVAPPFDARDRETFQDCDPSLYHRVYVESSHPKRVK